MEPPKGPLFYDTGEPGEGQDERLRDTARRLGYQEESEYCVLSQNRQRVEEISHAPHHRVFANFVGAAHPKRDRCAVCTGAACEGFDPFIETNAYGDQLETLQGMVFATPQEAIDCYTFFNMLWDWRRRRAVKDYFEEHYPIIGDAIVDIQLGFHLDLTRKQRGIRTPIPRTAMLNEIDDAPKAKDEELRPYCSSVYVPKLAGTDEEHYGIHFVDVKLPLYTETITYLTQMLNPSRDFAARLLSRPTGMNRRSTSSCDVQQAREHIVQNMLPRSKSMSRVVSNGKQKVPSKKQTPTVSKTTLKLRRTVALKTGNKDVERVRELERYINDPRPGREERLKKTPELKAMFERGFPRVILISDSPILEKRTDYIIRRNKNYCNVFSLKTPLGPPNTQPQKSPW